MPNSLPSRSIDLITKEFSPNRKVRGNLRVIFINKKKNNQKPTTTTTKPYRSRSSVP